MATRPAFGWDFRYVWGLRGLVSALAESHMSPWMVWFPNHWFHPDYPPAWPDLLSAGTGPAVSVVAVWGIAVVAAYVTTQQGVAWQLSTSLDRVLIAPLPAALACAIGVTWKRAGDSDQGGVVESKVQGRGKRRGGRLPSRLAVRALGGRGPVPRLQ